MSGSGPGLLDREKDSRNAKHKEQRELSPASELAGPPSGRPAAFRACSSRKRSLPMYHLRYGLCNTCATLAQRKGDPVAPTAEKSRTTQDTSFHDRWLAEQKEDPEFRAEFERARREIEIIDAIVNKLDSLRDERGLSKAELARQIGKNPASIRRLLTSPGNPELRTVIAVADSLGAEIQVVPRTRSRGRRRNSRRSSRQSRETQPA
jgi:DNA-binding phage protein